MTEQTPATAVEYRVWAKFGDEVGRPVSRLFKTAIDAEIWCLKLNTMDCRVEEEDMD